MKNALTLACSVAFAALAAAPVAAETPSILPDQDAASSAAASGPGQTDPAAPTPAASPEAAAAASPAATSSAADPFAQAVTLSDADLAEHRGGESIAVANQTLKAITSGNIINGNVAAGPITLSDGALSNFNGVGNFAINTGAQVSLQSGMNLTINISQ